MSLEDKLKILASLFTVRESRDHPNLTTRRTFVRWMGATGLLGLSACSGPTENNRPPPEPPAPVEAITTIRAQVRLPSDGGEAEVILDGSDSKGDISGYIWDRRKAPATEFSNIGTGKIRRDHVSETGTYEYRLTVQGELNTDTALHDLEVLPSIIIPPYGERIAFFRYDEQRIPSLYLMRSGGGATKELGDQSFNTSSASWEPGGKRLVFSIYGTGRSAELHIYDIETKTLEKLISNSGIVQSARWNPKGTLIAYVDDTDVYNNGADELKLIDLETKEVIRPSGVAPGEVCAIDDCRDYFGFYPSWFPDGEHLAFGSSQWFDENGNLRFRIGIYHDLLSGNPKREQLNSESHLREVFGSDLETLTEGANGVAVSPDGTLIAYTVTYGVGETEPPHNRIAIANANGSGIIRVLDRELAFGSTWSPDGKYLYFQSYVDLGFHIFRSDSNGGNIEDLSPSDGYDVAPGWYH